MATSTSPTSTSFDPQTVSAQEALDEGTRFLEQGDFDKAAAHYQKSIEIKETAIGQSRPLRASSSSNSLILVSVAAHYNLGVVQYVCLYIRHDLHSRLTLLVETPSGTNCRNSLLQSPRSKSLSRSPILPSSRPFPTLPRPSPSSLLPRSSSPILTPTSGPLTFSRNLLDPRKPSSTCKRRS